MAKFTESSSGKSMYVCQNILKQFHQTNLSYKPILCELYIGTVDKLKFSSLKIQRSGGSEQESSVQFKSLLFGELELNLVRFFGELWTELSFPLPNEIELNIVNLLAKNRNRIQFTFQVNFHFSVKICQQIIIEYGYYNNTH